MCLSLQPGQKLSTAVQYFSDSCYPIQSRVLDTNIDQTICQITTRSVTSLLVQVTSSYLNY